jgi:hypothetical protein
MWISNLYRMVHERLFDLSLIEFYQIRKGVSSRFVDAGRSGVENRKCYCGQQRQYAIVEERLNNEQIRQKYYLNNKDDSEERMSKNSHSRRHKKLRQKP